jgi:hypothetical protein
VTTIKCIITTLMLLLLSTRSSAEYVSMKVNAKDSNAYLGCMIGVVPMGGSSRFALYQKFFSKDVIPENLCEGLWETPFEFSDSEADGTTSNLIDHEIIYFFKLARHFVKLEQLQITPNIPNNDDTKKTCEIIDLVKSEITKGEISFSNYKRHSDNPSSNLTELFDWQNMSKMRARIEQLLSDPIESLDLLGELFSEVEMYTLRPHEALESVLSSWEQEAGFQGSVLLCHFTSAINFFFALDQGFIIDDQANVRSGHGRDCHRIQANLILRALKKNPLEFMDEVELAERRGRGTVQLWAMKFYKNFGRFFHDASGDEQAMATANLLEKEWVDLFDVAPRNPWQKMVGNFSCPEFMTSFLREKLHFCNR